MFALGPTVVEMTPVVALAVKSFSIAITTYASGIIAADVLKTSGTWHVIKNGFESLCNRIKTGSWTGPLIEEQVPCYGLQPPRTLASSICGEIASSAGEMSSICPARAEENLPEWQCVDITEFFSSPCATNQQNKLNFSNVESDNIENNQVLLRKNPEQEKKDKQKEDDVGLKGSAGPHGTYYKRKNVSWFYSRMERIEF